MVSKIRLLIVDDHPIFRKGLRDFLEISKEIEIVGEASNGEEAIQLSKALKPDVILLDLIMPLKDGIQVIQELRPQLPETRFLILSSSMEDDKILKAIRSGAHGYLLKDTMPDQVQEAISKIYKGETVLHPLVAQKLMHEYSRPSRSESQELPLTDREKEVLKLVGKGFSNQEIAANLYISERTASTHITNILRKLNLENRTQAALYAVNHGFSETG
jgi:two-component system, NarL family, response regulator LiaR